mmetsp:Transcript_22228/g.31084  ORF Transcript_22228/g.31084 Transcript_22228/m.31084 type:complete len:122 (+) Transcript_22228:475-840(+)
MSTTGRQCSRRVEAVKQYMMSSRQREECNGAVLRLLTDIEDFQRNETESCGEFKAKFIHDSTMLMLETKSYRTFSSRASCARQRCDPSVERCRRDEKCATIVRKCTKICENSKKKNQAPDT